LRKVQVLAGREWVIARHHGNKNFKDSHGLEACDCRQTTTVLPWSCRFPVVANDGVVNDPPLVSPKSSRYYFGTAPKTA
jgi:hypothetical protein